MSVADVLDNWYNFGIVCVWMQIIILAAQSWHFFQNIECWSNSKALRKQQKKITTTLWYSLSKGEYPFLCYQIISAI